MQLILTVLHLFLALGLIGLILIQHGRGADAGAAFGSGASATVFGARGSASFITRSTAVLATLFFLTSMALAYFAAQVGEPKGLMDDVPATVPVAVDSDASAPPEAATDLPPAAAVTDESVPDVAPAQQARGPAEAQSPPTGGDQSSGGAAGADGVDDDMPVTE
jgi:preprotein translocase subunit SecG